MIAATHFDPVVGVDIHIIQPPGPVPPVPVPHPFIGMVIDPMEYAPIIGGTVKVNGMMRGVAGTGGKCLPPHIPIGGVFVKPPSNECEIFMGSQTVAFDGDPASRLGLPALSCHCIGMPSPPRKKPHTKPKSLELPTSFVLAVPKGPPVLIGGPPTISLMAMAMKFGMAVLGRALKKLRQMQKASKKWAGLSDKMRKAANKMLDKVPGGQKMKNAVSNGICKLTGHPVDVATGKVTTESVDIELPGPLPFRFARVWYSNSDYVGPLGHGWHHSYDLGLYEFPEGVVVRLPDGRFATFELPTSGEAEFNRTEKLFLRRTAEAYEVETLDGLIYSFSWRGKEGEERPLREVRDPNGNRIELVREKDKLTAFIDSGGRRLPVVTDKSGRITEIRGPDPENPGETFPLVTFAYSKEDDLVEVLDALGHPFRYAYGNHLLLKETDRAGLSFYFMYDSDGPDAKCLRTWGDGDLYLRDLTYDAANRRTTEINSLGHKTVYEWNDAGLVTAETNSLGGVTKTEWGLFNEKLSETNANGEKTSFEYDDVGRLAAITNPMGNRGEKQFDAAGNAVSFTNGAGATWRWEHDDRRNATALIDPLGGRTAFRYARGLLTAVQGVGGAETRYEYDSAGNLTRLVYANGAARSWKYDALGRPVEERDPLGGVWRTEYDRRDCPGRVVGPEGRARVVQYDADCNAVRVTEPGHIGEVRYGPLAVPVGFGSDGREIHQTFDTEGRLTEVRNARGEILRYEFDGAGRTVAVTDFDGSRTRYFRDAAGRLSAVVRPSGRTTRYVYDRAGRMTRVMHDGQAPISFKHRGDGQLMEAAAGGRVVRFARDPLGRVLREEQDQHWVSAELEATGFRSAAESSMGLRRRDSRDALGNLTRIAVGDWAVAVSRDAIGNETGRVFGSGVEVAWDRDRTGRPKALQVSAAAAWSCEYEWDGNRLASMTDSRAGVTTYEYAPGGYPVRESGSWGTVTRAVDSVGNVYRDAALRDRVYGPGGRLDSADGVVYRHDADGNLVETVHPDGGTYHYEWATDGSLQAVTRPDGAVVRFEYDPVGRRTAKHSSGRTTRWMWDGPVVLHEWQEADGRPEGEVVSWVTERAGGTVYGKRAGSEWFGAVTDDRGAVIGLTDASGKEVWAARYDLYGEPRTSTGGQYDCPFRFPGQYEDPETGLYYNHFRYYSPAVGRYISKDPIGLHGGFEPYAYVRDPLTWIDPSGLGPKTTKTAPSTTTPAPISQVGGIEKGPREARLGTDVHPDPTTNLIPAQQCDPASGIWPDGKSFTLEPEKAPVEGVFFETPAGRELPEGLACVPDGKEVGGPHGEGHVTVYNTRDMAPEEFQAKLNSLDNKPTVKIKKGKVTKIECK